jgi:hypothetical protein
MGTVRCGRPFFRVWVRIHVALDTIRIGPWRPIGGQDRVARRGRGTAISQAQLDFDILYAAITLVALQVPHEHCALSLLSYRKRLIAWTTRHARRG